MIEVILSYPNNVQKEILLSGVPRVGEHLRLANSRPDDPTLVVEYVLWVEGGNGSGVSPEVIVGVRAHPGGPQ